MILCTFRFASIELAYVIHALLGNRICRTITRARGNVVVVTFVLRLAADNPSTTGWLASRARRAHNSQAYAECTNGGQVDSITYTVYVYMRTAFVKVRGSGFRICETPPPIDPRRGRRIVTVAVILCTYGNWPRSSDSSRFPGRGVLMGKPPSPLFSLPPPPPYTTSVTLIVLELPRTPRRLLTVY